MLARQFRQVLLARDLLDRRVPEDELKRGLGYPSDFVLRKILQQARAYGQPQLEAAYFRLLEADQDSKTGRVDPALALELLLVDLCRPSR
jgi:DNA polymerase III delta subunit